MTIVSVSVRRIRKPDSKMRRVTYIPRYMGKLVTTGNVISIEYSESQRLDYPADVNHLAIYDNCGIYDHDLDTILDWVSNCKGDILVQCEMGQVRSKRLANQIHAAFPDTTFLEQRLETSIGVYTQYLFGWNPVEPVTLPSKTLRDVFSHYP